MGIGWLVELVDVLREVQVFLFIFIFSLSIRSVYVFSRVFVIFIFG